MPDEIQKRRRENEYQRKRLKKFGSVPDAKAVGENEVFIAEDSGTTYFCVRIGDNILKVEVS
jgi:hypothetical protein